MEINLDMEQCEQIILVHCKEALNLKKDEEVVFDHWQDYISPSGAVIRVRKRGDK